MSERALEILRGGDNNDTYSINIKYGQNISPEKAGFWHFISSLVIFIVWMVFLTNYLSRIVGPIIAFFITRYLRFTGTPGTVRIGSLSLSLLSGKLMFRNVSYVCEDFSIKINDGWIIFSYWKYVADKRLNLKKQTEAPPSRLHVSLNGLQLYIFNRLSRYREIAKIFHLERIFGEEKIAETKKVIPSEIEEKTEEQWDRIWAILGLIQFDISSGRLVAGNKILPYMLVMSFENFVSKIRLKPSNADRALLRVESNSENLRVSLCQHPQYDTDTPCSEPPRTMGDGYFTLLQTAGLEFYYEQDILGFETDVQQSINERRPVWSSQWRLGHNTVVAFGPWAEAQRVLIYSFFFPQDYQTAPITEMPKKGQRRIHIMHDMRVMLLHETSIDLWFLRENQLESVNSRCRPGSTIDINIWWIVREDGFNMTTNASLLNVETTTSLVFRRFLQCETLSLRCDVNYPREFNAKQTWTIKVGSTKPTLWMVWDHKRFFQHLLNEWIGDGPSDVATFVPYTVSFDVGVTDSFEVILSLNEGNWIDTTIGLTPEAIEAAIVGEKLNINFTLPLDGFLPQLTSVNYNLHGETGMALRMRIPSQSSTSPILSALFNTSNPDKLAAPSTHGTISKDPSWFEMWRTERVDAVFVHKYHTVAGTYKSDLPQHVLQEFLPPPVDHPRHLPADSLDVKIEIDGSEIQLTGMVVKFILELKNNYFGLYDQMTDVASADAEPQTLGLFNKAKSLVEPTTLYRSIDVILSIRIHNMRAHALTHMPSGDAKTANQHVDHCPVVFSEQFVVEMKKTHIETMVQVGLGTCVAYFTKGSTSNKDGFIDLSGLQFRGHAMFSHVDVPWDMACVEYAWLMEVLVGDIRAKLHPAQMMQLVQFLDSFILVALAEDEETRLPDRFHVCQHGFHPNRCKVKKPEIAKKCKYKELDRDCPKENHLKYRHLRVGISSADVMIVENKSIVQLCTKPIRIALCNIHEGKYRDYLTIMIPEVIARQITLCDQSISWLEGAKISLQKTDLIIQLPIGQDSRNSELKRREYVLKHDAETKRIHFIYKKKSSAESDSCACYGRMRFFSDVDRTGVKFLNDNSAVFTTPEITPIDQQPGFHQSILRLNQSMFTDKRASAYYIKHTRIDIDRRKFSVETTADYRSAANEQIGGGSIPSRGSTASFHSVASNIIENTQDVPSISDMLARPIFESNVLIKAYANFLDEYTFQLPKMEMPQLGEVGILTEWTNARKLALVQLQEGINSLRLQSTNGALDADMLSRTQPESEHEENSDDSRNMGIGVQGVIAQNCDVIITPLGLEAIVHFVESLNKSVRALHPAYIAQTIYRKCMGTHHKQPLTASLFDGRQKSVPAIINCQMPPIHVCMFSCGVVERGTQSSDVELSMQHISADALFIRVDQAKIKTALSNTAKDPPIRFTFRQTGDFAAQFLHFVDKSRPDFKCPRVQLRSNISWGDEHELAQRMPNIDLRPVLDVFSHHLLAILDVPGGANGLEEKKINVNFGETLATFLMAKPLEKTARNEFPVYDVLAPSLTAWLYVGERLDAAAEELKRCVTFWEDMKIMKLLADALESPDDRVLKAGKSCLASVKLHSRHLASCPSCVLVLALLRYCAFCVKRESTDLLIGSSDLVEKFDTLTTRKEAITALLSHWQTVICKHIKLVSNEEAAKYREVASNDEKVIEMDRGRSNEKRKHRKRERARYEDVENGEQDGEEAAHTKMDLYQYVLRAHREIKERREGRRMDAPVLKEDINPMEISLLAFFYTFHRTCKLDWSFLDELPFGLLHMRGEIHLNSIKMDVVEQKTLTSSDYQKYLCHSTHMLLQLDKLVVAGKVNYQMEMDERKLRPVSVKIDIDYNCSMENVRCVVAISSVCLIKELSLVGMTAAEIANKMKRQRKEMKKPREAKKSNETPVPMRRNLAAGASAPSLPSFDSETDLLKLKQGNVKTSSEPVVESPNKNAARTPTWTQSVLDKHTDFTKSNMRRGQPLQRGNVLLHIKGDLALSVARLESILTDLCVAVSLQQIGVKHKDIRSDASSPRDPVDHVSIFLRRAVLTLMESEGNRMGKDGHILNCSLKESNASLLRLLQADNTLETRVRISLGAIEGDLPMAAHSLHDVVLRHGPQLEQQFNRLSAQPPATSLSTSNHSSNQDFPFRDMRVEMGSHRPIPHSRGNTMSRKIVQVNFHFEVASVELNTQLLPSLKAKYRLDKVQSSGTTGEAADWKGEINKHEVKVTVSGKEVPEVFTIGLPKVSVNGKYNGVQDDEGAPNTAKQLHYREGGYLDVIITLGHVEYNFTTDLLNQILFAEQSFRSELSLLLTRLKSSRPMPFAPGPPDPNQQPVKPLLYSLKIVGSGAPWFQLTASTPTSTAVRLTLDNLHATLTNKWVVKEVEGKERVFGAVELQLSAKLGQLFKPAQFNEVAYELQEYASFMTQIRVENKEGTASSTYSYVIALNRPILLIKSTAFDKAILLWLNYKNTYDYWRAERSKAERQRMASASQGKRKSISMFSPQPSTPQQEVDVNLSLAIHNGMYICMPLVGPEISDGMAALVVSLAKSDVTVGVKKELACEAGFESFKVAFVDNYDEQSLSDTFFKTTGSDSNFFYFPEGRYQFCSQASAVTGDAEWVLSVRSQMEGMKIDLDQKIGKLTKLLVNTFSSLGDDEDEWIEECGHVSSYSESDFGEDDVDKLPDAQELKNIQQPQAKIRWLEKKMHEQSVRVAQMVQDHAKEGDVEKERKKLRQLEIFRFKQFRRSMIEKIRKNRGYRRSALRGERESRSRESTPVRGDSSKEHDSQTPQSGHQSSQAGGRQQDTVNMHIDVQVNIASGSCVLRTAPKEKDLGVPVLTKKPSAKDLRKGYSQNPPVIETNFSIPSVDLKGYYLSQEKPVGPPSFTGSSTKSGSVKKAELKTKASSNTLSVSQTQSDDSGAENKKELVRKQPSLGARLSNASGKETSKRGCFYLNLGLASMPQETLVTPHLADFLEQVLEPLPPSSMFRSSSAGTLAESITTNEEDAGMVPIVAIDTSILPLDVIFNLTVQSSAIRFAGMQQRSSAADCLLKLPCLTLMASTRRMDGVEYLGGVDISVTLSAFSLSIFSPHQQATSHDALSLTLDHLSFVISRSKNSSQETDNKVRFVLTANVGAASFNYDMRRLNELIAFPKPWYRAAIMRRVFFGDQSVKPRTPTMNSRPSSRVSPMALRTPHRDGEKAWSATVLVIVQWKELNVFAQMSNTMGNTSWKARNGVLRGLTKLNSQMERDVSVTFKLQSSELNAHGGAISGQIAISQLTVGAKHVKKNEKPPRNTAFAKLASISARVEWMSRAVLIAKCIQPSISLKDEWIELKDQATGQINRSTVSVSVEGRWDDLQLVITKVTVDDIVKIANKLTTFFEEQLRSSKMVWGVWEASSDTSTPTPEKPKETVPGVEAKIWEMVLDLLTKIQMEEKLMHLPKTASAETIVGGSILFEAGKISLACMHGEMNASSWALFHMKQPHILFTPMAQFAFLDQQNTQVGISMKQKLILRLGPDTPIIDKKEGLATVCRVQQSRSTVMRQNSSIDSCLDYVIGEVLEQLKTLSIMDKAKGTGAVPPQQPNFPHQDPLRYPVNSMDGRKDVRGAHNVLELFQFPGLQAVLTSLQMIPCHDVPISPIDPFSPEVHSSFVCDFHSHVAIQTDFGAQVSFLPELLKSYMKNQDANPPSTSSHTIAVQSDTKKDVRVYKCEQWEVNPRIAFIERSNLPKWSPPLIDEILKKLQIFDHRTTIPKALQRGVLDPLDICLAIALKQLLEMAAKE